MTFVRIDQTTEGFQELPKANPLDMTNEQMAQLVPDWGIKPNLVPQGWFVGAVQLGDKRGVFIFCVGGDGNALPLVKSNGSEKSPNFASGHVLFVSKDDWFSLPDPLRTLPVISDAMNYPHPKLYPAY